MVEQSVKYGDIREKSGKFKRGNPGKPKGSKNKFTTLKDSFLEAFEALDGTRGLIDWAKKSERNRALFYGWITKMLPSNVDVQGSLSLTYELSERFLPKPNDEKK